jgi:hypothetical protein
VNFNELIQNISPETFSDVIAVSPRKVRESLYSHYGVKSKSLNFSWSVKDKKEQKVKQLHSCLKSAKNPREQEFLKELFRNWLFHQRPMLKATLDFLGVKNDDGLVEEETDFFKELSEPKVTELLNHLKPNFPKDNILIYLTFMEVPFLDKHLNF